MTRWAMLTGEYPPQPGGVSDYVRLVATALTEAGDQVDVYAPGIHGQRNTRTSESGVQIHRLVGGYGIRSFGALNRLFDVNPPDRAIVQYVPHAFGCKAMNLPFAYWVSGSLRRRAPVWVMFHEVAFPFSFLPLRHAILGTVTGHMAKRIASAAERVFVSIPAWEEMIKRFCPSARAPEWLPIPCLLPRPCDDELAKVIRRTRAPGHLKLIGHFGTFPSHITHLLGAVLVAVLERDSDVRALLLGRDSIAFSNRLIGQFPALAGRVHATGELPADQVVSHVSACDLLVQPYSDGVSSRRSSLMPALANGIPVVTNLGVLSEPLWTAGGVAAASTPDAALISAKCIELLANDSLRRRIGEEGRQLYERTFTLERTIATLRGRA